MFEEGERLYIIDAKEGFIQDGNFIESNGEGIWVRIKNHSLNTFIYSDLIDETVFKSSDDAKAGLKIDGSPILNGPPCLD